MYNPDYLSDSGKHDDETTAASVMKTKESTHGPKWKTHSLTDDRDTMMDNKTFWVLLSSDASLDFLMDAALTL